jgi:hypothetical protein
MLLTGTVRRPAAALAALAVLALGACGDGAGDGPAPQAGASGAAGGPASAPSGTPASASGGAQPGPSASGRPATPATARPPDGFTGLELARTGGFGGVDEQVTVRADGTWQRLDAGKVVARGKLTGARLAELQRLAADPALAAEAGRKVAPGRCADGFHYTLRVGDRLIRHEQCGTGAKPPVTLDIIDLITSATGG